jgi:hypothetical protein
MRVVGSVSVDCSWSSAGRRKRANVCVNSEKRKKRRRSAAGRERLLSRAVELADGGKVKWAWAGPEARRGCGHFRKLKSPPKEHARCCCKQVQSKTKRRSSKDWKTGRCNCNCRCTSRSRVRRGCAATLVLPACEYLNTGETSFVRQLASSSW